MLLIFLNSYFFAGKIYSMPAVLSGPFARIFKIAESARLFAGNIKNWRNLSSENEKLREWNLVLESSISDLQTLKEENEFLKRTLSLPENLRKNPILASVYYFNYTPGKVNLLINKGSDDGVVGGEIVITEGRVLIGKISDVFKDHSRVSIVSEDNFKITVGISGRKTTGIARGSADGSVYLDLVIQDEEVVAGDMVVSSGDDLFPPSLIIGRIDYVDSAGAGVFKKIEIRPSMEQVKIGNVLVIRK